MESDCMTQLDLGVYVLEKGMIYEGGSVISVHANEARGMVAVMNAIREEKETYDRLNFSFRAEKKPIEDSKSHYWVLYTRSLDREDSDMPEHGMDYISLTWYPLT